MNKGKLSIAGSLFVLAVFAFVFGNGRLTASNNSDEASSVDANSDPILEANDDSYIGAKGHLFGAYVCENDSEGNGYELGSMRFVGEGIAGLSLNNCQLTGRPTKCGVQSADYQFSDVDGDTATATITVDVSCDGGGDPPYAGAGAPSATDDTFNLVEGENFNGTVCDNDNEGPDYYLGNSMYIVSGDSAGLTLNNCLLQGSPNQCGTVSFVYAFTDQNGDRAEATVTLNIECK